MICIKTIKYYKRVLEKHCSENHVDSDQAAPKRQSDHSLHILTLYYKLWHILSKRHLSINYRALGEI